MNNKKILFLILTALTSTEIVPPRRGTRITALIVRSQDLAIGYPF